LLLSDILTTCGTRSNEKQKRIDFLETKVKDLRNSRYQWKQKAKQLEKLSSKDATHKMSNVQSKNNSSTSSSLLPVDEVVDKYFGLDDIEILPHSNGSVSLIPSVLLPWESADGHKYILLIQELAIKMVLQAHTSLRSAQKCFELFAQFFPVQVPTGR